MKVSRHAGSVLMRGVFLSTIVVGVTSQERAAIDWESDLDSAVARAHNDDKPIFLVITGGVWCDPCNWFSKTTLDDPDLAVAIDRDWIPLRLLDIDPTVSRWDETTVPAVLFLTSTGDEIERIVGNNAVDVIMRRLAAIRGDDSSQIAQSDHSNLAGAVFRVGAGRIWNAGGGKWYTEDIGLPLELEEYDRDNAFLYLRDPKSATTVAITVSPGRERSLWRWIREENSWDEIGALRRIE